MDQIPDREYSMAEVQKYLMLHRENAKGCSFDVSQPLMVVEAVKKARHLREVVKELSFPHVPAGSISDSEDELSLPDLPDFDKPLSRAT